MSIWQQLVQKRNLACKCRFCLIILAGLIALLDQFTKYLIRLKLNEYQVIPFIKHWNWTLIYNRGSAFGFLADKSGWQQLFFATIAFLTSIAIIYYLLKKQYSALAGVAISLILSGAMGNLLDRINSSGKVTDFIQWYIGKYYWPSFNIADSAICVGVFLLIVESFSVKKSSDDEKNHTCKS